jgi:hypothetical protein
MQRESKELENKFKSWRLILDHGRTVFVAFLGHHNVSVSALLLSES